MDKETKRELILENYNHPFHHGRNDNYLKVNTNNESCIDNLDIYFLVENNIVKDVCFDGEACAISTSATSIMLRKLVGKSIDEIKILLEQYENMILERPYDDDILEELLAYDTIYLQPNRKTCALLPVKAINKMILLVEGKNEN